MQGQKKEPAPVAENFEEELKAIKERAKEFKGENRDFYSSIIQRLESNNQCLRDLRSEHTYLRSSLSELVKIKKEKGSIPDIPALIKHYRRKVVYLKKQIDSIRYKRQEAVDRQNDLRSVLESLENALNVENPDQEKLIDLKKRLGNANIKDQEAQQLMKSYNKIIDLLERQKMHWGTKVAEAHKGIEQRQKDVSELILVARDSMFSKNSATNEFIRAQQQKNAEYAKREALLKAKMAQLQSNMHEITVDGSDTQRVRAQHSVSSSASMIRNRKNRQERDIREEKFRKVSIEYDAIREHFGTNDPDEIFKYFDDRQKQAATLSDQIEQLKVDCNELNRRLLQKRSLIEEAEYKQAKGVGGSRMLAEGRKISAEKFEELACVQKELETLDDHRRSVTRGVNQLKEVMALVDTSGEEGTDDPVSVLKWIKSSIEIIKSKLDDEDTDYVSLCNPSQLQALVAKYDSQFAVHNVDSSRRVVKRTVDPLKRPPKDNKNDVISRVLDRNTVKKEALKAVQGVSKK